MSDTVKPRLLEAGADCSKIKVIDESNHALTMLDERLEQAVLETGAKLIILDPIQAYLGGEVNMNSANETRAVMARLGSLAEKAQCAIVLIGHMNKGSGNKSTYRGLGSIDFQAAARSVLIVGRIKDNPELRVMAQDKSSLAPEGDAIAFELNKITGFRWIGHYDISVEDLLSGVNRENKTELAEKLIRDTLQNGQVLQSEVMTKARAQGISKRVMDEAKKILAVQSVRQGKLWSWRLPDSE